jgi:cation:H+ antiporter
MFHSLPLMPLVAIFILGAGAIWIAGVKLSNTTDVLSQRFGFGQALGSVILLVLATNLPEIAITVSAAWSGDVGVAVGNILGGIAIQTVVLVALFGGNAFLPVLFLLATVISGKAVLPQAHDTDIYLAGLAALLTSVYLAGLIFRPKRRLLGMGIDSLAVPSFTRSGRRGCSQSPCSATKLDDERGVPRSPLLW